MANELPEINPFNAVYQSEKYYDFDPKAFKEVGLPTLKTIGGGIADIILPQDEIEVAMHAVPPLLIFKKVNKILSKVGQLRAQSQSLFNSASRSGSKIEGRMAKDFEKQADKIENNISKKERQIHDDYLKTVSTKEGDAAGIALLRKTIGQKPSNFKSVTDNPSPLYSDILNKLSKDNPNELPQLTKQIMKDNAYTTSGIKIIANQNQITPKEAAHLKSMLGQHTLKKLGRDSGENVYEYRGHELFNPKGYGDRHSYNITPPGADKHVDAADSLAEAKLIIDKMLDEI